MPMPSSGAISMSQANVEMGRSATASIDFDDSELRILSNNYSAPTTALSMNSLYGKSWRWVYTRTSSYNGQMNVHSEALSNGWDGKRPVDFHIASGVTVNAYYTSATGEAVRISGNFPRGIKFFNAGSIVGRGGGGAYGAGVYVSDSHVSCDLRGNAVQGGPGLRAYVECTVHNTGAIRGGGGSGRGGNPAGVKNFCARSGTGGAGGGGGRSNYAYNSLSGSGGTVSGSGGERRDGNDGAAGTSSSAGSGGAQHTSNTVHINTCSNTRETATTRGGSGGNGGSWGAAGSASGGTLVATTSAVAGEVLCTGGTSNTVGGSAGLAVRGNNYITWTATGTRTGPISS